MKYSTSAKQVLIGHLRAHSVRTDGPFTLRSGTVSTWYIDARQTTFSGEGARAVGAAVLEQIDEDVDAVGGMTMGADPIAVATAIAAAEAGRTLRSFSVRKETKAHGMGGRLVGPIGAGDTVVALEDTTTTGSALVEAIDAMIEGGMRVVKAVALVDRSGTEARERVRERGIPYVGLVTPADLGMED